MKQLFGKLKEFDQRRSGFPGEHLIVATIGWSLLRMAMKGGGLGGMVALMAGGALLARAASGRDGLPRLARLLMAGRLLKMR